MPTMSTKPTSLGTQKMDRTSPTPSMIKGEMSPEVKIDVKAAPALQLLPKAGEARSQPGRQMGSAGGASQNPPLATARLSAECQRRHFNPKWLEKSGSYGFKCSVQLVNKIVHGDRAHPTAYDAKQAVAEKALGYVLRLPREDPADKVAVKPKSDEQTDRSSDHNWPGRAPVNREPVASANPAAFHGQPPHGTLAGANTAAYYSYNEHRVLLYRIQSVFGGARLSQTVLSDPLAAQAFLQGFALGTSIHAPSSAYDAYFEPQGLPLPAMSGEIYRSYEPRERSPAPNTSGNYRDRSPPRRRLSHEPNSGGFNPRAL
ncbi:hypothetical protein GGR55DRAFT_518034 [Xylaria sp. FL0064]|nr:hypothetical protein GGR55DRAFT_518034 [Xylaria sp. FL0064]